MHIILYVAAFWYVLVATLLFKTWLTYMDIDQEMTFNQQILSWFMLLLTSTFWVVFLPLTYLELLRKQSTVEAKNTETMKFNLRN
jgi:hypothetical protein